MSHSGKATVSETTRMRSLQHCAVIEGVAPVIYRYFTFAMIRGNRSRPIGPDSPAMGLSRKRCLGRAKSSLRKQTNSAFIGTDLEAKLRAAGHTVLVICGVITNNSVEATVRMAGNLGFDVHLVEDACFTFAKLDWQGRLCSAEAVHALSLANLHGEYCTVLTTEAALRRLEA
jgi:hypothetical protein